MTTAVPSTALATIQPAFTDAERLALAGYLAGYRGLTREAYALDLRQFTTWCRGPLPGPVRRPPCRHRRLRPGAGSPGPGPRDRHPAAVHHRRVLPVRGRRRTPGALPGRARPPSAAGLRVACRRPGPQRARRAPGRRRARPACRACADLAARAERAAGIGSNRRGHRAPGPGARAPDSDDHPQGRQGRRPSRWRRGPPGRSTWPSASERTGRCSWPRTGGGWTGTAPGGSSARPPAAPGSPRPSRLTRCGMRSSPRRLDAGVPLRDVQEAASHADPRTTMRYDRARGSLDRHATYIVAAYVAGAAR